MSNEELVLKYQLGGEFNEILTKNEGMVRRLANKFCPNKEDFEDYLQEGRMALEKAARDFLPERETKFSVLAWNYIKNRFINIRTKSEKRVDAISISTMKGELVHKNSDLWQTSDLIESINLLPPHYRRVIMKVYFSPTYSRSESVMAKRGMPELRKILEEDRSGQLAYRSYLVKKSEANQNRI